MKVDVWQCSECPFLIMYLPSQRECFLTNLPALSFYDASMRIIAKDFRVSLVPMLILGIPIPFSAFKYKFGST